MASNPGPGQADEPRKKHVVPPPPGVWLKQDQRRPPAPPPPVLLLDNSREIEHSVTTTTMDRPSELERSVQSSSRTYSPVERGVGEEKVEVDRAEVTEKRNDDEGGEKLANNVTVSSQKMSIPSQSEKRSHSMISPPGVALKRVPRPHIPQSPPNQTHHISASPRYLRNANVNESVGAAPLVESFSSLNVQEISVPSILQPCRPPPSPPTAVSSETLRIIPTDSGFGHSSAPSPSNHQSQPSPPATKIKNTTTGHIVPLTSMSSQPSPLNEDKFPIDAAPSIQVRTYRSQPGRPHEDKSFIAAPSIQMRAYHSQPGFPHEGKSFIDAAPSIPMHTYGSQPGPPREDKTLIDSAPSIPMRTYRSKPSPHDSQIESIGSEQPAAPVASFHRPQPPIPDNSLSAEPPIALSSSFTSLSNPSVESEKPCDNEPRSDMQQHTITITRSYINSVSNAAYQTTAVSSASTLLSHQYLNQKQPPPPPPPPPPTERTSQQPIPPPQIQRAPSIEFNQKTLYPVTTEYETSISTVPISAPIQPIKAPTPPPVPPKRAGSNDDTKVTRIVQWTYDGSSTPGGLLVKAGDEVTFHSSDGLWASVSLGSQRGLVPTAYLVDPNIRKVRMERMPKRPLIFSYGKESGFARDIIAIRSSDGKTGPVTIPVVRFWGTSTRREHVGNRIQVFLDGRPCSELRMGEGGSVVFAQNNLYNWDLSSLAPHVLDDLDKTTMHVRFEHVCMEKDDSIRYAECTLFIWNHDDDVIVSDVDGTITLSDVGGHINTTLLQKAGYMPNNYAHAGVCALFSFVRVNFQCRFLYLSARPLDLCPETRNYLRGLRQESRSLPLGPCVTDDTTYLGSLKREVVNKSSHLFKSRYLVDDLRRCFVQAGRDITKRPVYMAGFGNKDTDLFAYKSAGIHPVLTFIIDKNSVLSAAAGYASELVSYDDPKLFGWVSEMMALYKNNKLPPSQV